MGDRLGSIVPVSIVTVYINSVDMRSVKCWVTAVAVFDKQIARSMRVHAAGLGTLEKALKISQEEILVEVWNY